MLPYASYQAKTTQHENLPKLKNRQSQEDQNRKLFINSFTGENIKGVVGEAISLYTHNNYSIKHAPTKPVFDTKLRHFFEYTSEKAKNKPSSIFYNQEGEDLDRKPLKSKKKAKYFIFERLNKMNSESYDAYSNWLSQKRKITPVISIIKEKSDPKNNEESNSQTVQSQLENEKKPAITQVKYINQQTFKIFKIRGGKVVERTTTPKEECSSNQLFVTRTNLIRKSPGKEEKKACSKISYPSGNQSKVYKYYLGPGNNHEIIKKIFLQKRPSNWVQTNENDTLFNLKWEQYTEKSLYNRLDFSRFRQLINHFQFHEHISTKAGLIETLRQYCNKSNHTFDVFNIIPITFIFDWRQKGKFQEELKKFIYCYCINHPDIERQYRMERDYVDLSRFLWKGLKYIPNMNFDKNSLKKMNTPTFSSIFKETESKYLWILKPSDYNRGRGIKIFSTLEELGEIIKQTLPSEEFVIQKYIEKPLLVKGRKFDVRVWVLVDQEGTPYFCEQGYIRTSSQYFSLDQNFKQNQYIHLTNNAVQKNSEKYGKFEEGNQLSFDDLDISLEKEVGYFKKNWLPHIKNVCKIVIDAGIYKILGEDIIKYNLNSSYIKETYRLKVRNNQLTMDVYGNDRSLFPELGRINKSIQPKQTKDTKEQKQPKHHRKKGCFEIFGFDFMIDNEEKVWLIEVNTNPCLETSSKILERLIPRMIDDAFSIVLDPVFKCNKNEKIAYPVEGYSDTENIWSEIVMGQRGGSQINGRI